MLYLNLHFFSFCALKSTIRIYFPRTNEQDGVVKEVYYSWSSTPVFTGMEHLVHPGSNEQDGVVKEV